MSKPGEEGRRRKRSKRRSRGANFTLILSQHEVLHFQHSSMYKSFNTTISVFCTLIDELQSRLATLGLSLQLDTQGVLDWGKISNRLNSFEFWRARPPLLVQYLLGARIVQRGRRKQGSLPAKYINAGGKNNRHKNTAHAFLSFLHHLSQSS